MTTDASRRALPTPGFLGTTGSHGRLPGKPTITMEVKENNEKTLKRQHDHMGVLMVTQDHNGSEGKITKKHSETT